ncbi:hypothetical protein CVT24_011654 [Panaeolus cyanescens]|uniref:Uncharacterized protein n=1 Tax=Panaeolus cyanescens TaxID=181874 RepID=A0A409WEC3_9AGAR|nr:hypothetical protein CVT24_011654 [Panaeolus cyanescens]
MAKTASKSKSKTSSKTAKAKHNAENVAPANRARTSRQPFAPIDTNVAAAPMLDAAAYAALEDRIAALSAQVAERDAQLIRLNNTQAANPATSASIPRPLQRPYGNLQNAMGLSTNDKMYNSCRAAVRETVKQKYDAFKDDWRHQDVEFIQSVRTLAEHRQPYLRMYTALWATFEIMKTVLKNGRQYKRLLEKVDDVAEGKVKRARGGVRSKGASGTSGTGDGDEGQERDSGDGNGTKSSDVADATSSDTDDSASGSSSDDSDSNADSASESSSEDSSDEDDDEEEEEAGGSGNANEDREEAGGSGNDSADDEDGWDGKRKRKAADKAAAKGAKRAKRA